MNPTFSSFKYLRIFQFFLSVRIRRRCVLPVITFVALIFFFFSLYSDRVPTTSQARVNNKLHSLCLVVPFRDRFEEMYEFVPHIAKFLEKQDIDFHIFIMNQIDRYRFNRGALINVGFIYSTNASNCDYIAMHDVDLLPLNSNLSYAYPQHEVFHIAAPQLHPSYHYPTFIGGIVLMNNEQFRAVDGLSNRYWGWGREDDELYVRLKNARIPINRPNDISTNAQNTFKHIHGPKRKRDYKRCFDQKIQTSRRDRVTGLHNVDYKIYSARSVEIGEISITFVNVELNCDRTTTPWCICDET